MLCASISAGTGNSDHIGDKVALPPVIHLTDGVYEVGRTSPADIRIQVPTVSSRHALLRVGERHTPPLDGAFGVECCGGTLAAADGVCRERAVGLGCLLLCNTSSRSSVWSATRYVTLSIQTQSSASSVSAAGSVCMCVCCLGVCVRRGQQDVHH